MGDSTPKAGEHHTQKSSAHAGNEIGMERKKIKDALMRERNKAFARRKNFERWAKIDRRRRLQEGRRAHGFVGRNPLNWCPS